MVSVGHVITRHHRTTSIATAVDIICAKAAPTGRRYKMLEIFIIITVVIVFVKFIKALGGKAHYEEDPCAGCKHNRGDG